MSERKAKQCGAERQSVSESSASEDTSEVLQIQRGNTKEENTVIACDAQLSSEDDAK